MNIQAALPAIRKVMGADIEMMVARCPAYGDSDCCVIINGRRHSDVAGELARVSRGVAKEITGYRFPNSEEYTYSEVVFDTTQ